jgi:hypothetical protein
MLTHQREDLFAYAMTRLVCVLTIIYIQKHEGSHYLLVIARAKVKLLLSNPP